MTIPGDRFAKGLWSRSSPPVSGLRKHRAFAIVLTALLVAAVIGGVIVTIGGGQKTAGAGHPVPTAPPREEAAVTSGAKWLAGPAGRLLAAVNTDLGRLNAAQRADQRSAVKSTGARLAAGAKAALRGPMPPMHAYVYESGLKSFERAGALAARGDFSQVRRLLNEGNSDITRVAAAANSLVAFNMPVWTSKPNGSRLAPLAYTRIVWVVSQQ